MNKFMLYAFVTILFVFMTALMIGPRVPDEKQRTYCVHNIYINNFFGFSLNCDSPDFIILASNPSKLLEKNNVRQDRPGFVFFATIIKFAISLIEPEVEGYTLLRIGKSTKYIPMEYVYTYYTYIIINILFILGSFFLFVKINNFNSWFILFFLGLLLIINDITKAFVLSPHSQMLNIFSPLFCLWSFFEVVKHNMFKKISIFFVSVLTGILITTYASFFLFLPAVLIPAILIEKPFQTLAAAIRFLWRSVIIICLTILPSLLWYLYVLYKTGSFYSHSTEAYHHVVWMKDALQDGLFVLVSKLFNNTIQLIGFAGKQGWILLIVLLPFIMGRSEDKIQWQALLRSPMVIGSIFISVLFLVFFAMVGLIVERVAYTAIPPMIVLSAYIMQHLEQKSTSLAYRLTPVIIFTYGIYEIVKDGPYS